MSQAQREIAKPRHKFQPMTEFPFARAFFYTKGKGRAILVMELRAGKQGRGRTFIRDEYDNNVEGAAAANKAIELAAALHNIHRIFYGKTDIVGKEVEVNKDEQGSRSNKDSNDTVSQE